MNYIHEQPDEKPDNPGLHHLFHLEVWSPIINFPLVFFPDERDFRFDEYPFPAILLAPHFETLQNVL